MVTVLYPSNLVNDKTVFDLLNINTANLERAVKVLNRSISENNEERILFKQNDQEIFIFKVLEIKRTYQTGKVELILKHQGSKYILMYVKALIDNLYKIYGEDDLFKNGFSLNDILDLFHEKEITRMWKDIAYPIELTYSKGGKLEMRIDLN